MFKTNLKLIIASLLRRKWFTLLTLLSVALALVIVTCAATLWNMWTAPIAPEVHKQRTFFLDSKVQDKNSGKELYFKEACMVLRNQFFLKEVYQLTTPELVTIFDYRGTIHLRRNNLTQVFDIKCTDHNFFLLFDFEFITGKPYMEENNQLTVSHCVISEKLANYYFGTIDCLGKYIKDVRDQYRVCGVIRNTVSSDELQADLYYQINPKERSQVTSWYDVAFLCPAKEDKKRLDKELNNIGLKYSQKQEKMSVSLFSNQSFKVHLRRFLAVNHNEYYLLIALVLVVLVLPSICLIDVLKNNLEYRYKELGIRRAFGANRGKILNVLLAENLVITFLGGLIGLLMAYVFLLIMIDSSWTMVLSVFLHWKAFFWYLGVFLSVGLLSGLIPASRLSKIQIINALNDDEND
jgi:putative ABC transport system permease protein